LTSDGIDQFQRRSYGWRVGAVKRLQRAYVRAARRVIVPSRYLGGLVEGWGVPSNRIRVVYNAVSLDGVAREPIDWTPGPFTILTAGRLSPWKGMDRLLEVVARVRQRVPAVRLVVAGDGPMAAPLQEASARLGLEASVRWLGAIPRGALVSWMEAADLFVLLSEYEGFPHVALEAMTAGLPVILSRTTGNPELVSHGRDGLLVDPGDLDGCATAIADLAIDDERRRGLALAARDRAADFDWSRLVSQTLDVFEEVAPAASRGVR
jgi:glycosyltransferase involved in cell wall biosynthesis